MASLFVMLGLPLLIYAYMFIYRIVRIKMKNKKMNDILKSVYLIATRDLSNLWLQFLSQIKGLCDFLRKRF